MAVDYSIRSLCYAHVDLPADFFGGVPIHSLEGPKTAPMHYVLLSSRDPDGQEHHHLVDVGFADEHWIGRFGFYDWESPEKTLARVGLTPDRIEKVFISHMHFDHVNALRYFPDAELYVQRREWDGWVEALALPALYSPMGIESWITSSFDRNDIVVLADYLARGKLHFVGDRHELLPGVTARLSADGHTFGTQWLCVETPAGDYIVASDTVFWYSNVEEMWPSGYTNGSTYRMLLTYGEIVEHLDGDLDRLVPGHDMRIFERFPSFKDGTNEVAEVHLAEWDRSSRAAASAA